MKGDIWYGMKLSCSGKTTVERVAELAMRLGRRHPADSGATCNRHDFTQRQLMACLIVQAYLNWDATAHSGIRSSRISGLPSSPFGVSKSKLIINCFEWPFPSEF